MHKRTRYKYLIVLFFTFSGNNANTQITTSEKQAKQDIYNVFDNTNWTSKNEADMSKDWCFTQPITDVTISKNKVTRKAASILSPNDFVTTWKTDNPGVSNSTSITIPTSGTGYNYDVDWNNDGVFEEIGITGDVTHDFGVAGTYTIRIRGQFDRILFGSGTDKEKILAIEQWGNLTWSTFNAAFMDCVNLHINASDAPDLTNVTRTDLMFYGCTSFNESIDHWDVSNITIMSNMFKNASSFNQDLNSWDTNNVQRMNGMFYGASNFNGNISNWNTSSVTTMQTMFRYARAFNQNIGNWRTGNVTDMSYMFDGASSFNQNIGVWNVQNVTNMSGMFQSTSNFNQYIGGWNTQNVTDMNSMFRSAISFNQNINSWNTSNVTDMTMMFYYANFNQDISSWDTGNVQRMAYMFGHNNQFNQPIGSWNMSRVTDISSMFYGASNFNQDLSNWDTSNISDMHRTFGYSNFNQDIGSWNISSLTDASEMFVGVTLSTTNYDALLIGWQGQTHNNNVVFSGGNSQYCAGETAITDLIADGWTITDGGLGCVVLSPDDFVTTWKTDNPGTSNSTSITIPTYTGETYNYDVDWDNDGTFDEFGLTGNVTHDFGTAGTYTIRIRGNFPRIYFNGEFDREKILSVDQWGKQVWTSMHSAFQGCSNLTITATDIPDLSNVTQMINMFQDCISFNQDISNWDISNVTYLNYMFFGAVTFNQPLNNWNTSNVINMQGVFSNAKLFNQPLNNWDTSKVTTMNNMFSRTEEFNGDITNWDTSNVTNMQDMFWQANKFNQDIGNWDTSNVTTMYGMFTGADVFNQDISYKPATGAWNTANVTIMSGMFADAYAFNQDISNWDTSSVTDMKWMFQNFSTTQTTSFNQDISSWNTSNVTSMVNMFKNSVFNQDIGSWNISSLTDASEMFEGVTLSMANYDALLIGWQGQTHNNNVVFSGGNSQYCAGETARTDLIADGWTITDGGLGCVVLSPDDFVTTWKTDNPSTSNSTSITIPTYTGETYNYDVDWDNDGTFDEFGLTGNVTHDFGTAGTYTIRIRGQFPRIYFHNELDKDKIISVDQWGSQVWSSMGFAFYGCTNLAGQAVDNPDLSQVTSLEWTFNSASSFNQDISGWDTNNVTKMNSTFNSATSFNQDIGSWDTSKVQTMNYMFNNAKVFNQDLSSWDTSNVTNMYAMFSKCLSFNQPLNTWNTGNVETMAEMFSGASIFNQDLDNWDTSKVKSFHAMFWVADAFNASINSWDTSSATNMSKMFGYAGNFNQPIGSWDTSNVTDMSEMFTKAYAFNQNISNWNTGNVTNMESMFWGASSFNKDIGTWNTSKVTNMAHMFRDASVFNQNINTWNTANVTTLNDTFSGANNFNMPLSNWDTGKVVDMHNTFRNASNFNQDISSWQTNVVTDMSYMFYYATSFDQNIGSWNISSLTDASKMFDGATLSMANYDALLIGWQGQTHNNNVVFSGGNSQYCAGETARTDLIADGWTITDGGLGCPLPSCTQLTDPADSSTDVALNQALTWTAVSNADGYYLTIGTTSGGSDVLNHFDVGNTTTYTPATDWQPNTTYYVTVTAYNSAGEATGCNETSFTTLTPVSIPNCTQLTDPADGSTDIALNQALTWTAVSNADGYYLTIGTTSGGSDVLNHFDVGNTTTYTPATDWQPNTTYYVTVTAYNSAGEATGCNETRFTTKEKIKLIFPKFFTPNGDTYNDVWSLQSDDIIPKGKVYIFDRYGKVIKQMSTLDSWDGTYNNLPMHATDYWFKVVFIDGKVLTGHFSLIR